MDPTTSGSSSSLPFQTIVDPSLSLVPPLQRTFKRVQRHCFGDSNPGEFPLAETPSIVLIILTNCDLEPRDLANLEASIIVMFLLLKGSVMLLIDFDIHGRQHVHFSESLQILLLMSSYLSQSSQH